MHLTRKTPYRKKSHRLRGHNYSRRGMYFITMNIHQRHPFLGEVRKGKMYPSDIGFMLFQQWKKLPERFPNVRLHSFVIMPDHFHAIIQIIDRDCRKPKPETTISGMAITLSSIIGAFSSIVTVEYIRGVKAFGWPRFDKHFFQPNFWDRVIWNREAYKAITRYIRENPKKWHKSRAAALHARRQTEHGASGATHHPSAAS